jgi:hypothetical protein
MRLFLLAVALITFQVVAEVSLAQSPSPQQTTFEAGQLSLRPGAKISTAGLTLEYQSNGNLVARDPGGKPVWDTGTLQDCGGANCKVAFQEDGNLVLRDAAGKTYWHTHTARNPGAKLILKSEPPYLTISAKDGSLLWESNLLGAAELTEYRIASPPGEHCGVAGLAHSQIPGHPDLFVGRVHLQDPTSCRPGLFTLALFRMDWRTKELALQHYLLSVPTPARDGMSITNAYDPYVMAFAGDIWVAFECLGKGFAPSSTCIAPLTGDFSRLDLQRFSAPVASGNYVPNSPTGTTASDPKLLAFRGRAYVYWTGVEIRGTPHKWLNLTARGMELELDPQTRRLWGKGSAARPVFANDPRLTVEVLARDSTDQTANLTADIQSVYAYKDEILVAASIGGAGCLTPDDDSIGCYRLQISKATSPLGENVFGRQFLVSPPLAANPATYVRFALDPQAQLILMGPQRPLRPKSMAARMPALPSGNFLYPVHPDALQFSDRRPKLTASW